MIGETYNLYFRGYWLELHTGGLPAESGIYGVHTCVRNLDYTVTLKYLIYVGESDNVRDRVAEHERWPEWRHYRQLGEHICFNVALISPRVARTRAEAAMIRKHEPICNNEYKYKFPFDVTTVNTHGSNHLMERNFTVYRKLSVWSLSD